MGNIISCKKRETFGINKSKFKETYSPIFCPFLICVVVKLLNDAGQTHFTYTDLVSRWGGGIKLLRKCTMQNTLDPDDPNCTWDTLISRCAAATSLSHPVWNELLKFNKIKSSTSRTQNIENLLMHWVENGHKYRTFGPYPKAYEQELYIQDTVPTNVSAILNYAIISDVFAESYVAMERLKRNKIRQSVVGKMKIRSRVPSDSGDEREMTAVTVHDAGRYNINTKPMKHDMRPTDERSARIPCGLWLGIFFIEILCIILMIFCREHFMVMSWMSYSTENHGFWHVDWGWNTFVTRDHTKNGIPTEINMPNAQRIQNDITPFMSIVFVLITVVLFMIIIILVMRLIEKRGYYFYIGPIKIPQRPMVYVLLEMITLPCLCLVGMFTMLLIYGMMELVPWARTMCTVAGGADCRSLVFPMPHFGFFLLLLIPLSMQCFVYKYAAKLDYKLDYKSMRIYYPEYYAKLVFNEQGIYVYDLLNGMRTLRKLLLLMLFAVCLQNSGMIMWVHVTDTGAIYLEPLGLDNAKRYDGSWVNAGEMLTVFMMIFIGMHFILLCYFVYVFARWKTYKKLKYVFLLLVTLEIVIWIILGIVFYFDFNKSWNTKGLGQKITDIADVIDKNETNKNYWIPDYGMILHLIIWVLMFKLWYSITKAM